ncbi:MAG: AMP-binding protein, partial [Nitrospirota bacterium]
MTFALHHLLSERASRQPEREAIRLRDESINYGSLERASNQLAHAMIESGVRPGDRVGIYLHKSISAVTSLFAVLKTGACYVPVDANAPGRRLLEIARQSEFRSLVTSKKLYGGLDEHLAGGAPMDSIFFLDGLPEEPVPVNRYTLDDIWQTSDTEAPPINVTDQDLAYILFTSGSTGTPKGVMLSHLNALTFVNWGVTTFGINGEDRLSNHAPFNFDLSVFDIFVAIKAGASISLVPEGLAVFPLQLSTFIQDQKITVWYSVPMVLTLLQARGKLEERDLTSLRWVLFAGEVFPTKHLRTLMEKL